MLLDLRWFEQAGISISSGDDRILSTTGHCGNEDERAKLFGLIVRCRVPIILHMVSTTVPYNIIFGTLRDERRDSGASGTTVSTILLSRLNFPT